MANKSFLVSDISRVRSTHPCPAERREWLLLSKHTSLIFCKAGLKKWQPQDGCCGFDIDTQRFQLYFCGTGVTFNMKSSDLIACNWCVGKLRDPT